MGPNGYDLDDAGHLDAVPAASKAPYMLADPSVPGKFAGFLTLPPRIDACHARDSIAIDETVDRPP